MPVKEINLSDIIIPKFWDEFDDILDHGHTHYLNDGGRGGTKSSLFSVATPLLIINNPDVNALCMRKVGNTIQRSVRSQIEWGIYKLGLEDYFKIPISYSNPIVYKPTGQQIIFAGLDDPSKIKSIKVPRGYIGITWHEELDQYTAEEIRNVLQSTMRGGSKFWNFGSFNPPVSKNNWANEYFEEAKLRKDTYTMHSTYLDVPADWLGEAFIQEAEILKELNPRAYEHEYLGIATGTGGDVFENVEDRDMSLKVEVTDGYSTKLVPEYETFDKIYNGLDWGFARDPFRFVRLHYDPKTLTMYIFDEFDTLFTRNEEIFNMLYNEQKKVKTSELVIADSAEQKSIADFKAYGAYIRGAEKGADSVRYGIKWLQGLRKIYIDKRRCPKTYQEFISYEYMTDREGNFYSAYPDENNHCLTGDTLINTPTGQRRIADMVGETGRVYSYDLETKKPVVANFCNCRMTFESAEIWEVTLEDDTVIRCTYDHPVLTSNRGYVKASELTTNDIALSLNDNIKIKSVNKTNKIESVYDLEVPKYHNFSIANGVIVHNSIDAVRYATERIWKRRGK